MRFFIDRCAGVTVAEWLRKEGHDVVHAEELGPDPGDRELLTWAANDNRIVVTIDKDFGDLLFRDALPHAGLIRLPDIPPLARVRVLAAILVQFSQELTRRAVVTVKGNRIRVRLP